MKIIQILHHSHPFALGNEAIQFNLEGWHSRFARQILKRTSTYDVECWRPERRTKETIVGQEGDITYKIFPSICVGYGIEYSIPLLRELKKLSENEEILIHLHGIYNYMAYSIAQFFGDLPIVGQDHGGTPWLYRYDNSRHSLRFLFLLNHIPEKIALNNVDRLYVLTKFGRETLSRFVGADRIKIQTMGVDFDKFIPIEKEIARVSLGLPIDRKIILYVGRFDKTKRVDLILKSFEEIKKQHKAELILIGGHRGEPFYEKAKSAGALVLERIPSEKLLPYYSSADAYCCFYNTNLWGGIGIAPVESLACNTPICSNTLEHFPTNQREYLGELPKNTSDITGCLLKILDNPEKYKNCREISRKYYDWDNIIKSTLDVYGTLYDKYY